MEDADSDAEMADYGTDFRTMSTKTLMPGHSRIGNRIPRFPDWGGGFPDSRFPIGRESGIGNRETGRFPIRPGTGNRGPGAPGAARRGFPGLRVSWS
jgi:hypothetical protein